MSINRKAWDSLPSDLQRIIKIAAAANNLGMLSEFETKNLEALHTLQHKHKVNFRIFPDDVLRALKQHTRKVLQEQATKNKIFAKVHRAYSAFHKTNIAWGHISESAYARAKYL